MYESQMQTGIDLIVGIAGSVVGGVIVAFLAALGVAAIAFGIRMIWTFFRNWYGV